MDFLVTKERRGHKEYPADLDYLDQLASQVFQDPKVLLVQLDHKDPKAHKESLDQLDPLELKDHLDQLDHLDPKESPDQWDLLEKKENVVNKDQQDRKDTPDHKDHMDHKDRMDNQDLEDHKESLELPPSFTQRLCRPKERLYSALKDFKLSLEQVHAHLEMFSVDRSPFPTVDPMDGRLIASPHTITDMEARLRSALFMLYVYL